MWDIDLHPLNDPMLLPKRLMIVLVALGCLMRLLWPADMEWKADEEEIHALAVESAEQGTLPGIGIRSAGGIVNPGLSAGVFSLIARFSADPLHMVAVVQWANVLALLAAFLFAWRSLQGEERENWYAGLTLAAVNPLAILFSRKIWAQDLLPVFCILMLLGHRQRGKWWGAALWGLAGALIGQVHMSGFFLAFGLFLITLLHDRANGLRTSWPAWCIASVLGVLPMIPWIQHLASAEQATNASAWNMIQLNFFLYWLIDPAGLDLMYSLRDEFWSFLREPLVAGVPTWLVAVAHLVLAGVLFFVVRAAVVLVRRTFLRIRALRGWRQFFTGMSYTGMWYWSILLGIGILVPLAGITTFQHYLICTFPFAYLFMARMLRARPLVFRTALIAQLFVSACFLWYIHRNGGAPEGDYWITYRAQQAADATPEDLP